MAINKECFKQSAKHDFIRVLLGIFAVVVCIATILIGQWATPFVYGAITRVYGAIASSGLYTEQNGIVIVTLSGIGVCTLLALSAKKNTLDGNAIYWFLLLNLAWVFSYWTISSVNNFPNETIVTIVLGIFCCIKEPLLFACVRCKK
jgi:hypothetical protein